MPHITDPTEITRGHKHLGWLRYASYAMFGAGLLLVLLGEATSLGSTITLIGLLLIVAGVVKVVTVRIWHGFFIEGIVPPGSQGGTSHE
jgi:uncharacterized membrane protein HdeD (DUF308 family)